MDMTQLNGDEIVQRGKVLYDTQIRPLVETEENKDKFCVIDVESGDYEIDRVSSLASRRLRTRHPNPQLYGERIGSDVAYTFGPTMRHRQK